MFFSAFAVDLGGYKPAADGMLVGIVNLREVVVIKDLIPELIAETFSWNFGYANVEKPSKFYAIGCQKAVYPESERRATP
jgi:hypothetical protein